MLFRSADAGANTATGTDAGADTGLNMEALQARYNPTDLCGEDMSFGTMAVHNPSADTTIYNVARIDGNTYILGDNTSYSFREGDELFLYYYQSNVTLPVYWVKEASTPTDEEKNRQVSCRA